MRSDRLLLAGLAGLILIGAAPAPRDELDLANLQKLGQVDERFQSYNIEMAEVVGGRFWAPYGNPGNEMFRARPPLDLTDPRLLNIARNLGPAYMRISGTWANNTYVAAPGEKIATPPDGFKEVLTADQWRNAVALAKAANAEIVTSFAVSTGTRGPDGVWTTTQAQRLIDLTKAFGGTIAAAEFFNEPNMPTAAQPMPKVYTAANYGAEFRIFRDWARKAMPGMKIIGPGGIGEGDLMKRAPVYTTGAPVSSADMLAQNPNSLDALSYHFYGSVSPRCEMMKIGTTVKADALKPEWLDRTLKEYGFYAALRDKFEPGKPMWLTETAEAACGGSPWASTFLDSFRYLNQLGALAQKGVQVVIHNTLLASDYALVDGETMTPRPDYWAAVLWRRVMGRTVLASPLSPSPDMRLYAQCLRDDRGGVGLLALNLGEAAQSLQVGRRASAWVMTGKPIDTRSISVNGANPAILPGGSIRGLDAVPVRGALNVPGQSIAFVAVRGVNNPACR